MSQLQTPLVSQGPLQTVLIYSLLGTLTPLIPVPLLDDLVLERIQKRMASALFAQHELVLSDRGEDALTESPMSIFGLIVHWVVMIPVKFVFKKLLIIKTFSDLFSQLFHEGWLLARALEANLIDMEAFGKDQGEALKPLRAAVLEITKEIKTSPLRLLAARVFKLRLGSLKGAASALVSEVRSGGQDTRALPGKLSAAGLGGVIEELMSALSGEQDYFQRLDERLKARLRAAS
jgi:hypothetical protein